ncbi:MAG: 2-oxo acid dehydrogenase subunit E2 [Clostridiales bacterium]|nr:2-oxo acid dehydrogenase subunit E2 [Clostridiales bacterium]
MFGHRFDGKRIYDIDPIVQITPYLMPMRCDAMVFLEHKLDYEKLTRYISRKAAEGEKITYLQIIMASYVRAVSQHPEVNRFIFNKQYYSRKCCAASYTILKEYQNTDSNETTVRIEYDLTDTIFDVRDRMTAAQEAARAEIGNTAVEKIAKVVLGIPGLTSLIVWLYRLLDRYGLAPSAVAKELPFYCGAFMTNNASIGLHHVWHHIYNFGNVSLFMGMGSVLKEATVEPDGRVRMKRWLPIGITADERVCSGAHYAAFFADVRKYFDHPELLEVPPETVRFDPGVEYHVPKVKKPEPSEK